MVILEQRTLKTEMEIDKEKKLEADVNKSIAALQHRLTVLNETLIGKKGYRETLDKENMYTQAQFVQQLKVFISTSTKDTELCDYKTFKELHEIF